jgi:hypothetical protein
MTQISKRKRSDGCIEKGLFSRGDLSFGEICTAGGIKAQGEFSSGQLVTGKILTPNFISNGDYYRGELSEGCRLFYTNNMFTSGTFLNNKLKEGVIVSQNIEYGMFDRNQNIINGIRLNGHDNINMGHFIMANLKEGIKIHGDTIYKGEWNIDNEFIEGTKLHCDGKIEKGKFSNNVLFDGIIVSPDNKVEVIGNGSKDKNIYSEIKFP